MLRKVLASLLTSTKNIMLSLQKRDQLAFHSIMEVIRQTKSGTAMHKNTAE